MAAVPTMSDARHELLDAQFLRFADDRVDWMGWQEQRQLCTRKHGVHSLQQRKFCSCPRSGRVPRQSQDLGSAVAYSENRPTEQVSQDAIRNELR